MINSQIENNLNTNRLLNKLADNLGIDYIQQGSNIKKMTDSFVGETLLFSDAVDSAISDIFLGSASPQAVQQIGALLGIYRQNYQTSSFNASDNVVTISLIPQVSNVTATTINMNPFKAGDIVTVDSLFQLQFINDVVLTSNVTGTPISGIITAVSTNNSINISANSTYQLNPTQIDASTSNRQFLLTFNKAIGISTIQEALADYVSRLYESTYASANGANSLVSTIAKQIPYISFLETENIESGRSIQNIYVYTDNLISYGEDQTITDLIIPLIQTGILNRALPGTSVKCSSASPIRMSIEITSSLIPSQIPVQSVLNNVSNLFNKTYSTFRSNVFYSDVINYVNKLLSSYNIPTNAYNISIVSPLLQESIGITDYTTTPIDVPLGRFLRIDSLYIL